MSFKAFTQQTLFDGSLEKLKPFNLDPIIPNITSTVIEIEICEKIKSEMVANEYYLNQNLTLHDFAKEIQVSARTISNCINQNIGLNFNEWVNNHRVDTALEIIKADVKNQLSIEGIGFDAGFKSRSAMYAAFKKRLGHSPGHFR